jgi:TRAP-type C4-dicarboxylate transport system substrate-binding protein
MRKVGDSVSIGRPKMLGRRHLTIVLGAVAIAAAGAAGAAAGNVTLKAGTHLPSGDAVWFPHIKAFLDKANEGGKPLGLEVRMVAAGPQAMPPFELGNAVKAGVLDIVHVPATYYSTALPIADAQKLSTTPVQEERTNGTFDYLLPIYREKMNVHYLGRMGDGVKMHLYLRTKVDGPDLTGKSIRASPVNQAHIKALNGTAVMLPPTDTFIALERGVADGFGWPLWGIHAWGWQKFTKYRIEPGVYFAELSVLVNLDTWKKLTKEQQDTLTATQIWHENEFVKVREVVNESERKKQADDGIQVIEFQGADREKFVRLAHEAGWADLLRKDPVHGPRIKELTTK